MLLHQRHDHMAQRNNQYNAHHWYQFGRQNLIHWDFDSQRSHQDSQMKQLLETSEMGKMRVMPWVTVVQGVSQCCLERGALMDVLPMEMNIHLVLRG